MNRVGYLNGCGVHIRLRRDVVLMNHTTQSTRLCDLYHRSVRNVTEYRNSATGGM
jgi:hypothetical protein